MIIGILGTISSGKGVVADYFKDKGFNYFRLSDIIKKELNKENKEVTRTSLQNKGNELRDKFGNNALAELALKEFNKNKTKDYFIDGIRTIEEIEELRNVQDFFLIGIDAPLMMRFERTKKRNKERATQDYEQFLKEDARDRGVNGPANGQATDKCMGLVDYKINNDQGIKELKEKIEEIYQKISIKFNQ